jgi:hypothetical protein
MSSRPQVAAATTWPCRVGGALSLVVSVALLISVTVRGLVNGLNLWTIVLGGVAGLLALQPRATGRALVVAVALLVGAALPALIGGIGWLYLPSLILLVVGIFTAPTKPA